MNFGYRNLCRFTNRFFTRSFGEKLMACDNNTDGLSVLRILSEIKKKPTILQKRHSYLICEKSETLDVTVHEDFSLNVLCAVF